MDHSATRDNLRRVSLELSTMIKVKMEELLQPYQDSIEALQAENLGIKQRNE
jgi:hypothetical protein